MQRSAARSTHPQRLVAVRPGEQAFGPIEGTVTDASGAVLRKLQVKIHNGGTDLEAECGNEFKWILSFSEFAHCYSHG